MQENVSNASFALLGRTYLREKMIIALFFLLTPGIYIPKQAGKKKDCVAIGTQSDMYV